MAFFRKNSLFIKNLNFLIFIFFSLLSLPGKAQEELSGGLNGYISAGITNPPQDYGFGVSFYVSSWALLDKPIAYFQVGLPSTWIVPDNTDFNEALCPP